MRKLVAGLVISLDGVVESPDKWGFQYFTDEMYEVIGTATAQADADETTDHVRLKLVESRTYSTGVVGVGYQPARA